MNPFMRFHRPWLSPVVLGCLIGIGMISTLYGQAGEDGSEIFDSGAFDAGLQSGQLAAQTAKVEWLYGLTFVSDGQLLLVPTDATNGEQWSFFGKTFLKVSKSDVGAIFISAAYRQSLLAASNAAPIRDYYQLQHPDLALPAFSLSEFHLSFDLAKTLFVRIGDQLLAWGASRIWSPADFINNQPQDAGAVVDGRSGKSGIRLHLPLGGGNIFAFVDFSKTIEAGIVQEGFRRVSYALRGDATLLGFNLGLLTAFGPSAPFRIGGTFSGALLGIDLWGELGSQLEYNAYPFNLAFSIGGEKSFGLEKEWTFRTEYFHQTNGHGDSAIEPYLRFTPLYWGYDYVFAELADSKLFVPWLGASLGGTINLSDLSWQVVGGLQWTIPGFIPFTTKLKCNAGGKDREFTWPARQSFWSLEVLSIINW